MYNSLLCSACILQVCISALTGVTFLYDVRIYLNVYTYLEIDYIGQELIKVCYFYVHYIMLVLNRL